MVNAFYRVSVLVKCVMVAAMQVVVHLGAKQVGINTCRELFSLTGGVCRFASHLVS